MKAIVNGIDAQGGIQYSAEVDSPNALTLAVDEANATLGVAWVQIEQQSSAVDDGIRALEAMPTGDYMWWDGCEGETIRVERCDDPCGPYWITAVLDEETGEEKPSRERTFDDPDEVLSYVWNP
jgi:hypothetical protein